MLNSSIDLSNPCNLNCPYCFIEEKNSHRKVRRPDELSLSETKEVIDDFVSSGCLTINLVGAGEPTIDPHFKEVVAYAYSRDLCTVVFTNGIALATDAHLAQFLYRNRVSVVIKYNSRDSDLQDLVAGRKGYTRKRDRGLEVLLDSGFAAHEPTRLGLDIMVFRGNLDELPEIHRFCRDNNLFPIAGEFIPTGRTEGGHFHGHASISANQQTSTTTVESVLQPVSNEERLRLLAELARIDLTYGIERNKTCAYYGGGVCTQILGLYVDIQGQIWPCVARKVGSCGGLVEEPLGVTRRGDRASKLWREDPYLRSLRTSYNGGCPYKAPLRRTNAHE
jgi:MoaA/NifB/PqqE/SkfB family radical SAM enzyme